MSVSLESILKRDRWLMIAGLSLVILLAWGYILSGAGMGDAASGPMAPGDSMAMGGMPMDNGSGLLQPQSWTMSYAVLLFSMWWIMMVAMMLPSAAPTILLAATLNRKSQTGKAPFGEAGFFTAGYLLIWAGFSLMAVLAQWGLERSGVLSSMMQTSSPRLAGGLLLAAGLWQFTPVKRTCLVHCRTPVHFLTQHHHSGRLGGLRSGIEHGSYCVGCCWLLMALLFVGGVMNLYWVAGLAALVLIEKLLPLGPKVGLAIGLVLGLWGLGLLAGVVR